MFKLPIQSDFSIHNLPFGIFSTVGSPKRIGVALGDRVIDLYALGKLGVWDFDIDVLKQDSLNSFIALGKSKTNGVRKSIREWFLDLKNAPFEDFNNISVSLAEVDLHLPVQVGDYTDFYSSLEHATNVGKMFRDPEQPLLPNWKHLPVGYHGRASTIIPSGQPIRRPKGQILAVSEDLPGFGPTQRLDFELEMGFIVGKENRLGESISTAEAEEYIFGLVLCNDWSARDIQKWEYVPLGPFLGKSFATSISPWVIPLEALDPFRVDGPIQDPTPLPYLQYSGLKNYDIHLEVHLEPQGHPPSLICQSNFKYMYWNMVQQLTHHTSNGCQIRVGDLMASGTLSGKTPDSYGSLLELSWGGKNPLPLNGGASRTFLEDGDSLHLSAYAENKEIRVGFGSLSNTILPSL